MSLLPDAPPWPDGDSLPQQWQYFVVADTGANPLSNLAWKLDEYGRAGWELCGVAGFFLIFKRPFIDIATKPPVQHRERVAVEA